MKILFLNPLGHVGGAERVLLNVLKSIRANKPDWSLTVVLGQDGPLAKEIQELSVDVKVLPFSAELAKLGDWQGNLTVNAFKLIGSISTISDYIQQLKKVVRENGPDLIYTNGLKMDFLGLWAAGNIPVIAHIHDYVCRRRLTSQLFRCYGSRFRYLIAVSQSIQQDLLQICPKDKVRLVYNGVDTDVFSPEGETADLDALSGLDNGLPGVLRVGLVSTFAKWKGQDIFLKALSLLPAGLNVRAYMIGGPIYETSASQWDLQELTGMAEDLKVRYPFGFTGFIDPVAQAYRALDIVVHASSQPEPFGLTIIEAMACGKPVIASAQGGPLELIEQGVNGVLFQPNDPQDLADKISNLITDGSKRERIARSAREHSMAAFSSTKAAGKIIGLIDR